ncbi:unnamed protein product [Alopecurus aequalis]
MAQQQQPQASLDAPPTQKRLVYRSSVSRFFRFRPNGRFLVAYYMAPKAFYGRVPDDMVQDAVDEGVDVYGTRPEDLPFWNRSKGDYGEVKFWGYFFTTRPATAAAAAPGGVRIDIRRVAAGGLWKIYGRAKVYANEDGDVVALRRRFAFYDEKGKLTPWRMKEYRLNEGAAAFRGIAFHPSARGMALWKVYNHVEIPEVKPLVDLDNRSSGGDQNDGHEAEGVAVGAALFDQLVMLQQQQQ